MTPITVRLAPAGHGYHTLEIVRSNGSSERIKLESKTFLMHDFIHYSVESLAGLEESFWGTLAAGKTLSDLGRRMDRDDPEALQAALGTEAARTEMIVGPLTGVIQGRAVAGDVLDGIANVMQASQMIVPSWLTEDFVLRVQKRMKELIGQWNSLEKGEIMELPFPAQR